MPRSERKLARIVLALVAVAALAGTSIAIAQKPRRYPMKQPIGSEMVDRIAPSEMYGMLNYMAADSRGAILPTSMDGRAHFIINARRDASEPERHAEWDDVMIVQSGYGYVDWSTRIKGGARYGQGEWRGGVLVSPVTTLELGPGVVVRIPAGVPHVIRPLGAAPLVYLVLKEEVSGVTK